MKRKDRPAPLVPVECDLRDFAFMPLDVVRLRDSGLTMEGSGDEFRAAVLLWCAAWRQIPAGSLPNDEKMLAALAGYGRDLRSWRTVWPGARRGWQLCSDGRLYHAVVCEKALAAWGGKMAQRQKTAAATAARWKRNGVSNGVSNRDSNGVSNGVQGTGTGIVISPKPPEGASGWRWEFLQALHAAGKGLESLSWERLVSVVRGHPTAEAHWQGVVDSVKDANIQETRMPDRWLEGALVFEERLGGEFGEKQNGAPVTAEAMRLGPSVEHM